ncbi:MAG: imelysin family protein [Myxococcota bacterium]|nr:imelysin family protein [Myxococcota bacterium]
MMLLRILSPLFLSVLFFGSCGTDDSSSVDSRSVLIQSWGEGIILPWYRDFEQSAQQLQDAAAAFCLEPSASVALVQSAWITTRKAWKRTEVIAFGPYKNEPLRIGPKVDFWPARPNSVDAVLSGTSGVSQEDVANMGAASKGFPAIEYLLWSPPEETDWLGRRCDYLIGLTSDLAVQARAMRQAWDPEEGDYLGAMLRSGTNEGAFPSLLAAAGEIPNRMAHTISNIRRDKLTGAESPFALHAKDDILENLYGIETLFEGTPTHPGTAQILGAAYSGLVSDVRLAFDNAIAAVDALPPPLNENSDPTAVEAADAALRELHTLLSKGVLQALGFVETFNDADGD